MKRVAGKYFKVVYSDDWIDKEAYLKLLKKSNPLLKTKNVLTNQRLQTYSYVIINTIIKMMVALQAAVYIAVEMLPVPGAQEITD